MFSLFYISPFCFELKLELEFEFEVEEKNPFFPC